MLIKLNFSVKHNKIWYGKGASLGSDLITKDEARTLIRKRAAVELPQEASINFDEVDDKDNATILEQLSKINGINEDLALRLAEAGLLSVESIANTDPDTLIAIKGIGAKTALEIQESASEILNEDSEE